MKVIKYIAISILVGIVLISNNFVSGAADTEEKFIVKHEQFVNSDTKITIIEDAKYGKEYILVEKHGKGFVSITPRLTDEKVVVQIDDSEDGEDSKNVKDNTNK